jgi:ribonuclease HII
MVGARDDDRRLGLAMNSKPPSLRFEADLFAGGVAMLAGADEVGRGALGGPVSAGVVLIESALKRPPRGLRDSKLLTPAQREALVPRIKNWVAAHAVGHASAAEIDAIGILAALRLAGERALAALPCRPDVVLLDGNYDWFTRPFRSVTSPLADPIGRVVLKVKADLLCASSSAASVLAKVERDAIMRELAEHYPGYGWRSNKGYATPEHLAAIADLGPSEEHRRSWRLPEAGADQLEFELPEELLDLSQ